MALPVLRRREVSRPEQVRPKEQSDHWPADWTPYEPFAFAEQMFRRMDQLMRSIDPWGSSMSLADVPTDIEEVDDAYVVQVDLPGVSSKDVDLEWDGRSLRLHGEVKERTRTGFLRWQTRRVGRFDYVIQLPGTVDGDKAEADLSDGVLTVRIPKAEHARRRRIEITSKSSA